MTDGIKCKKLVDNVMSFYDGSDDGMITGMKLLEAFDSCTSSFDSVIDKCNKKPSGGACRDISMNIFMGFINCLGGTGESLTKVLTAGTKVKGNFVTKVCRKVPKSIRNAINAAKRPFLSADKYIKRFAGACLQNPQLKHCRLIEGKLAKFRGSN